MVCFSICLSILLGPLAVFYGFPPVDMTHSLFILFPHYPFYALEVGSSYKQKLSLVYINFGPAALSDFCNILAIDSCMFSKVPSVNL